MSTTQLRIAGIALLFLIIFLSGYWLSRSGKPYGGLLFNVHKLIALGALVLLFLVIRQANGVTQLNATEIAASVVTGLFFLGMIISGGLVSTDLSLPAFVRKLHHIAPYLTALSTAVTLYLLQSLR